MELIRQNGDYSLLVLVRMADQPVGTAFSISALARQEGVPEGSLYRIVQKLVRAGIVGRVQRHQGGISLSRPPNEITVRAVLEAIQGPFAINQSFTRGNSGPNQLTDSLIRGLMGLQENVLSLFEDITIDCLVDRH